MSKKNTTKRMDKPLDSLAKRQAAYAGDIIHQFFDLPGEYLCPLVNEYPDAAGSLPRVDSSYLAKIEEKTIVVNREDESGIVGDETLEKINNYRINLEYATKLPVMSVVTSDKRPSFSLDAIERSPTLTCRPIERVYSELGDIQTLNTLKSKILDNEVLSNVDGMTLVMLPRFIQENREIVLEEVCELLKLVKIENKFFKLELIYQMKCIIHKYAKTLKDIIRLEEVIGLQQAMSAMDYQMQAINDQGVKKGMAKGIEKGEFNMALRIKEKLGIEKALELSDFSREELESGKLNEK